MIYVCLIGGLGNQMFQYALGRSLADKKNSPLRLDTSWFEDIENINTKRQYELGCYPITAEAIDGSDLNIMQSGQAVARKSFIKKIFKNQAPSLLIYTEPDASFHPEVLNLPDNVYLKGYWQNERYFMDIRPRLLREFTPNMITDYTRRTANRIQRRPSVSLHVRRGDYVNNPLTNKFHGLTPVEYYMQALEYVRKKLADPQLFVFSDDIKWCKSNLPFAKAAEFITGNPPERACEDLYLMSLCDSNIIANSSFSWWGAWLNENRNKTVVAPKSWFQDKAASKAMQIVPKNWHRI